MKRSLDQSIIETLAFYETRNCGRTPVQLLPYILDFSITSAKLEKALKRLAQSGLIVRAGNDYGLSIKGAKRTKEAVIWANKKRLIANQIAKVMGKSPFIRMVALTQSVAMETAKESSDVDIFTVAAPNRLWTARFITLASLKLARLAKKKGNTTNHGCFGFWIDETAMSLSSVTIKNDIYLSFWLAHLEPLINKNQTYEKLVSKNHRLLTRFPNWHRRILAKNLSKPSPVEWLLGGWFGDWLEMLLFKFQSRKIWKDEIASRSGASVITNRSMCKLHHFDARAEIRDRWISIIKEKSAATVK